MAKKIKIVTVCGCGLGSSLMAAQTIDKIVKEFGLTPKIEASDVGTAKGYASDIIITTTMLKSRVGEVPGTPVLAVKSFMNEDELREVMRPHLEEFKKKHNL
ncbi:MAG TPA: PTS sugar transporter subunit IIB [Anaerolineae bacterium]|nr:PTS sugar transporter subunit IIB [Anaerolineae bacterium]